MKEIKVGQRFWCAYLHRYMIFTKMVGNLYCFEDFGDQHHYFDEYQIKELLAVVEK